MGSMEICYQQRLPVFLKVDRKCYNKRVTFDHLGKLFPHRGNNKFKVPEAEVCLAWTRISDVDRVAAASDEQERGSK